MYALSTRSSQHAVLVVEVVRHQCHTALAMLHTALRDKAYQPRHILYIVLAGLTSVWLAASLLSRARYQTRQSTTRPSTPNLEKRSPFKAADRKSGGTVHAPYASMS